MRVRQARRASAVVCLAGPWHACQGTGNRQSLNYASQRPEAVNKSAAHVDARGPAPQSAHRRAISHWLSPCRRALDASPGCPAAPCLCPQSSPSSSFRRGRGRRKPFFSRALRRRAPMRKHQSRQRARRTRAAPLIHRVHAAATSAAGTARSK